MLLFLISFIDICLMSNKMLTVNYIFCWTLRNEYTHVVVVKLLSFVQLLQLHGLQHTRLPCPSVSPGVCLNSCPLSQWCHPITSSSLPPFPPAFNLSQHQGHFQWVGTLHQVANVLELQFQHQSFQWIFRVDFLLGSTRFISLQS